MSATEAGLQLKSVPPRRMRAEVRPSCQAKPESNGGVQRHAAGPVVVVQFLDWQEVPAHSKDVIPGTVWSKRRQRWQVKLFNVVGGNSTLGIHSTVTQATLDACGARVEYQVDAGLLDEGELLPTGFWQALKTAADMARDGNLNLTITALEQALHLAKVQVVEQSLDVAGVAQA